MAEICQNVQDRIGMPAEWVLSNVVPIFKAKGDIGNYSCNRAVKLLEHGMKEVERVLEKRLCRILSVDDIQFSFMPERATIDVVFIKNKKIKLTFKHAFSCMCINQCDKKAKIKISGEGK